ncbi:uncharacterized protein LOC142164585 [Nicotiana tabacum]|uniref:Uncharacterized protein LOC142164585 n=2 Tax=Nicotiana tabacum TaxID=4097 RepID=A0AC58S105_TOBAC
MHGLANQVSVSYKYLCPFPDVQLPAGFKMPKFDLYEGYGDPMAHLQGFCSKMRGAGGKDELLLAYFGQSLSGSALEWYTRQDSSRWYTWDDLAQAFAGHFQYNLEIVPDRLTLLKLEKKTGESFTEFGFRSREQAARVDPPMREGEMVDYFLQTLEPTYFGHLVTSVGKSFNKVLKMGGMVEEGLKSNKIMSYSATKATTQAIQSGTGGALGKRRERRSQQSKQVLGPNPEALPSLPTQTPLPKLSTHSIQPSTTLLSTTRATFLRPSRQNLHLASGSPAMACTGSPTYISTSTKHIPTSAKHILTTKGLQESFRAKLPRKLGFQEREGAEVENIHSAGRNLYYFVPQVEAVRPIKSC